MKGEAEVFIIGSARTPIGGFRGALSGVPAPALGAAAIKAAVERSGIGVQVLEEVILGNVLSAGLGQAPARQAAIAAGIPDSVPAMGINEVCGSGMRAVMLVARGIRSGECKVAVAGGMESMSQAPYLLRNARAGFRLGHQSLTDSMIHDGLWDSYSDRHMGQCAEVCARENGYSRADQDAFAAESYRRAQAAQREGKFTHEIVPVEVTASGATGGAATVVSQDEGPGRAQLEKMPRLKPAFDPAGTITAANASSLNDGAAALVLASGEAVRARQWRPIARLVSWAGFAQSPEWFTTAPAGAIRKALAAANWSVDDIDLFEINEAFALVAMDAAREFRVPREKLNVWGGAIALGHPIGASGARILVTLLSALRDRGLRRGLAAACIGGGQATAVCVELVQ